MVPDHSETLLNKREFVGVLEDLARDPTAQAGGTVLAVLPKLAPPPRRWVLPALVALGLLSLVRKYGKPRLEAACLVALELGTARYSHVRDILANGRDRVHAADTPQWTSPQHAHVRGPGYYQ